MLSGRLNYNFYEIVQYSSRQEDIVGLSYLHFHNNTKIAKNIDELQDKILGTQGNFSKAISSSTVQSKWGLYSHFLLKRELTHLHYLDIFTEDVTPFVKFMYLYYSSLSPPYSPSCFIPDELLLTGYGKLVAADLAILTTTGIILNRERN